MKILHALPIITASLASVASAVTTITPWGDGTVAVNYSGQGAVVNLAAGNAGAVGGNSNATLANRRTFYQVTSYNLASLLSELGGISLAELSGYTFTYAGTTIAGTTGAGADITDGFEYRAAYIGQWADTGTVGIAAGDVPSSGTLNPTVGQTTNVNWTRYNDAAQTIAAGTSLQIVDLDLIDTDQAQSLSAVGFDLSGLATSLAGDSDLSDNYLFFGFFLSPDYETNVAANQEISGVTLSAVSNVPEPATALLGGLGLLALLRRRRS
jgi:MYXO-CTERM domain-containing protein